MSTEPLPQVGSPVRMRPSRQAARQIPSLDIGVADPDPVPVPPRRLQQQQPPPPTDGLPRLPRTVGSDRMVPPFIAVSRPVPRAAPRGEADGLLGSSEGAYPRPYRTPAPAPLAGPESRWESAPAPRTVSRGETEGMLGSSGAAYPRQYRTPAPVPLSAPEPRWEPRAAPRDKTDSLLSGTPYSAPYPRPVRTHAPAPALAEPRWEQAAWPPVVPAHRAVSSELGSAAGVVPSRAPSRTPSSTVSRPQSQGSMRKPSMRSVAAEDEAAPRLPTPAQTVGSAPVRGQSTTSAGDPPRRSGDTPKRRARKQRSGGSEGVGVVASVSGSSMDPGAAHRQASGRSADGSTRRLPRSRSGTVVAAPQRQTSGPEARRAQPAAAVAPAAGPSVRSASSSLSLRGMLPQRALSIRDAAVSLKHKLSSELGQCYSSAATREAEREAAERRREEAERLAQEQQLERDRQRAAVLRGAQSLLLPALAIALTPFHTADSAQRAAQQMQKSNSARRRAAEVAQAEVSRARATVKVCPSPRSHSHPPLQALTPLWAALRR